MSNENNISACAFANHAIDPDDRAYARKVLADIEIVSGPRASAVHIVCRAFPGPGDECVFIEAEDQDGRSIKLEWRKRHDGFVQLVVPAQPPTRCWEAGAAAMGMNFVRALGIAKAGFEEWATKPHNHRWARKIDGTPIPNDLLVTIAMAFVDACNPPPSREG